MPVIKSAKKKLRQDKKSTLKNVKIEVELKDAVKKATIKPSEKTLRDATSFIDKAAKRNIIHKNKAARLKSRLARLLNPKKSEAQVKSGHSVVKKTTKSTAKKATKKSK